MWDKSFVIILIMILLKVYVVNSRLIENMVPLNVTKTTEKKQNFGQELIDYIVDVGRKIKAYAAKAEVQRKKIKKAFRNFVAEAFSDKDIKTSSNIQISKTENVSQNIDKYKISIRYDNLGYNSKIMSNQLITSHGYETESHIVNTKDGYMLTNFRILPPSNDYQIFLTRKVIIFLHGLMGSSDDWLLLGSKKALPYLLLKAGYDVWLINFRGNRYSKLHYTKEIESNEFWDFSFHEMGFYDLPAVIDYVIDNVGKSDIHIIGYSMGSTALLVLLSTQPNYNKRLKSCILIAPLIYMHQTKGPLKVLAAFAGSYGTDALNFLGINEFMANKSFPEEVIEKHCRGDKVECRNPLLFLANGGKNIDDEHLLQNVLSHVPAGTSAKTIKHYVQLLNSGKFEMFDYGITGNLRMYGKKVPPSYRVNQVLLQMFVFSSHEDWLSTTFGVMNTITQLPNVIKHHVIHRKDFSHLDFLWGPEAPEYLFYLIIQAFKGLD